MSLLRGVLARAENGDITGLGLYWVEGQNDTLVGVVPGSARAAIMVSAAWRLFRETEKRW